MLGKTNWPFSLQFLGVLNFVVSVALRSALVKSEKSRTFPCRDVLVSPSYILTMFGSSSEDTKFALWDESNLTNKFIFYFCISSAD